MTYCIKELEKMIDFMSQIFYSVRAVDPVTLKVLMFDNQNELSVESYPCYRIWNKEERCANCISLQAVYEKQIVTKFEFIGQEIYQVISHLIQVQVGQECHVYVLEMVSKIADRVLFEAFGKNALIEKIKAYEQEIYQDSLTKTFNRRYFDDRVFCHNNRCDLSGEVVFIMADLKQFKQINDQYGHAAGDWALLHTAKAIQSCLEKEDSLIRMGGDEFLIVLYHKNVAQTEKLIERLKCKIKKAVVYNRKDQQYVVVNFGIAYTDSFQDDADFVLRMWEKADQNMYLDKSQ